MDTLIPIARAKELAQDVYDAAAELNARIRVARSTGLNVAMFVQELTGGTAVVVSTEISPHKIGG